MKTLTFKPTFTPPLTPASLALCVLSAISLTPLSAQAFTCTWLGVDSSIKNAANWNCGGGQPQTGDDLVFPAGAANKTVSVDYSVPPVPTFGNLTFSPGYTVQAGGAQLAFTGTLTAQNLNVQTALHAQGTGVVWINGNAAGSTYIQQLTNSSNIELPPANDGSGLNADFLLGASTGNVPITVRNHGRLSLASGASVGAISVASGGIFTMGGVRPYAAPPATKSGGSATSLDLATGATFEYRLLNPSYQTNATAVSGNLSLGDATFNLVQDLAGADVPPGTQLRIATYGSLVGQFAGLPEGSIVSPAGASALRFRLSYGPDYGDTVITLTRLPAVGAPTPPSVSAIPNQTGMVGQPFNLSLSSYFVATDGDPFLFTYCDTFDTGSIDTIFPGLTYNSATRTITGTPTATASYLVVCYANDKDGTSNGSAFTLTINPAGGSTPPILAPIPQVSAYQGSSFFVNLSNYATATEGDPITYTLGGGLPAGVTFDSNSGLLVGTPATAGTYALTLQATDKDGSSAQQSFNLVVQSGGPTSPGGATPPTSVPVFGPLGLLLFSLVSGLLGVLGLGRQRLRP